MAKPTFNQRELLFESGVCKLLWRKNYFMLYRSLSFCCNNSTLLLQSESSHRQMGKWACLYYKKNKKQKTKPTKTTTLFTKARCSPYCSYRPYIVQIPDLYDAKSELRLYINSKFKHWPQRMQFVKRIVYYVLKLWWLDIQGWIVSL